MSNLQSALSRIGEAAPEPVDAESIGIIRKALGPYTVPPCRVCGGKLSIQAVGGFRPTTYGCSEYSDEVGADGLLVRKPGRTCADDHYALSEWIAPTRHWPEVIECLDRMDALESLLLRLAERVDRAESIIDDAESYLHDVVSATTAGTDLPLHLDERVATLVEWYKAIAERVERAEQALAAERPLCDGPDKCRTCDGYGSYILGGDVEQEHAVKCERCSGTGKEAAK